MTPWLLLWSSLLLWLPAVLSRRHFETSKIDPRLRNYNLSITALHHAYLSSDYFGPGTKIQLHGPNDFSFRINITQTFPRGLMTVTHTFEKDSRGEYIPSITIREGTCEEYDKQQLPIYKCLHYHDGGIKECPFRKGVYSASHVRCSSADGPIVAPPGEYWRLNKTWVTRNNVVISATVFEVVIKRQSYYFPVRRP